MLDLDTAPGRAAAERAVALAMGWTYGPMDGYGTGQKFWQRMAYDGTGIAVLEKCPAYLEGDDPGLNREMEDALLAGPAEEVHVQTWRTGHEHATRSRVLMFYGPEASAEYWMGEGKPTRAEALVRALVEAGVVEVPEKSQVEGE